MRDRTDGTQPMIEELKASLGALRSMPSSAEQHLAAIADAQQGRSHAERLPSRSFTRRRLAIAVAAALTFSTLTTSLAYAGVIVLPEPARRVLSLVGLDVPDGRLPDPSPDPRAGDRDDGDSGPSNERTPDGRDGRDDDRGENDRENDREDDRDDDRRGEDDEDRDDPGDDDRSGDRDSDDGDRDDGERGDGDGDDRLDDDSEPDDGSDDEPEPDEDPEPELDEGSSNDPDDADPED